MSAPRPIRLFISYAHVNRNWMKRLLPLFNGFQYDDRLRSHGQRLEYVHIWHDNLLLEGTQWDPDIRQQLDVMDIFVPLVSFEFFGSSYIQNVELKRAKERHANREIAVVPICLQEMDLRQKCQFLHSFQPLPSVDKCWSQYKPLHTALRPIDDGLWRAISARI